MAFLAALIVGLGFVFLAPAAKAHCPHNGDDTHPHCDGGEPAPSAPSYEFQFIGFTDEAFNGFADIINGDDGMRALHALCQDDFGPDARMCDSEEFWLSPNAEAPFATEASFANSWLHSVGLGDILDFIGLARRTCGGWTRAQTIRNIAGKIWLRSAVCASELPITCCAPAIAAGP